MEENKKLVNTERLSLSSNQKRLWILSKLDKADPTYNIQITYHIRGELDIKTFQNSLQILFNRHHTLFSEIYSINNEPFIRIQPKQLQVEFLDFTNPLEPDTRERIFDYIGEKTRIPIDPERDSLYQLYLFKEENNSYFFCAIIHHIIFDGYSRRVFTSELNDIYNSQLKGIKVTDTPHRTQSYHFINQKVNISPEEEQEMSLFWKTSLKNCPQKIKYPFDYPRTENSPGFGEKRSFELSTELTNQVRTYCNHANVSVFQFLLSSLNLLLYKTTGEKDFCIGIPVSTRRQAASFSTVGFFVDTIPLRTIVNEKINLHDHIQQTADSIRQATQHSKLTFEKIVEIVKPERIPGFNPFFQVCFSWINNFTIPLQLGNAIGNRITIPKGVSSFDFTFYMWETDHQIQGEIEFNTDLLHPESVIRLKNCFLTLIQNLVIDPDQSIENISIIPDSDISNIYEFNQTTTEYPRNHTLASLFEEQVIRFPTQKAVVYQEDHLTYLQLNQRANQLAHTLRNLGVKPNSLVGIMADKSLNMMVGILGILKAGGAYLPIAPEYPAERLNFIFNDSGCKILLTQEKFLPMPFSDIQILNLDSETTFHADTSNPKHVNQPEDLAYIIYTSGTTGTPKGSLIPQRGVIRLVCNTNYIEYSAEEVVSQASAIVFDASTEEIFGAFLNGATLVLIDKDTLLDPVLFARELAGKKVTIVDLTSALFTQMAESSIDIFDGVKKLILGGDVVSAPHVNKLKKHNPSIQVINTYGPTENSCNSTAYIIEKEFISNIPIGKPISNSTAYILDQGLNYQPIGFIGELYVGGDGVSLGYLNRDDLNVKVFIDNPYRPGERLYKTGDLARWLPDGNIEFHGRADNQIKIRGYRVELEEIESVIAEVTNVIEAAVKPVKLEDGDYKLVAFLHVKQPFPSNNIEIARILKSKLPPYMIPASYQIVTEFPKTINGKIDRKALIIDENGFSSSHRKEEKDLSPTEQALLDIWKQMLNVNDILTTDNFFEIGGNSLMTISLAAKIENHFGIDFSIKTLFGAPKIFELAQWIDLKLHQKNKMQSDTDNAFIIEGEI